MAFEWAALDTETTGLSPTRDRLREIAVVRLDERGESTEAVLHFPDDAFDPRNRSKTLNRYQRFLSSHLSKGQFIAHNAAFDLACISEGMRRVGAGAFSLSAYCTLRIVRRLLPGLGAYDLSSLRESFCLEQGRPHDARDDARTVAALFALLVERYELKDENALVAVHGPPLKVRYRAWQRPAGPIRGERGAVP